MTLVEKEFWEEEYYWAGIEPPIRPDADLPFDRSLAAGLAELAPAAPGRSVMEIGCAPAKWLVFYGERFGTRVEGIEYSEKGAELSRANLAACGVDGTIHAVDFFGVEPTRHDLVVSLGFIEHFDDIAGVFARHVEFVKPGGQLVIGVPNYRGWNRLLQRWADPSHLALHNLRAMDPELYRSLATANGLEVEASRYLGGTDPIIVKLGAKPVTPIVLAEARLRRLKASERWNHRWVSPYLLTTFRRPA